jgi:UV DNA damage endonuclease
MDTVAYRLGFAAKILGGGGLPTADLRRPQSGPHLRTSLEYLDAAFDHLERIDVRVFRLSGSTIPYGTHPDLPELDYRRQLDACGPELEALGARVRELGLRLSTHPGQYTVLNTPHEDVAAKALLDLEQDAALFDALGLGPEAVIVIHVGGVYGEHAAALDRFCARFERLSAAAAARVVVENDERAFDLADVLELHRRLGVRVVFDIHHHRCNPAPNLAATADALAAACGTWPAGVRPKVHLSSPRTELRTVGRGREARVLPPLLEQHADFATPWDLAALVEAAPGPVDVMVEAKAKDLAIAWLRAQTARLFPALAAAEERGARLRPAGEERAEEQVAPGRERERARTA